MNNWHKMMMPNPVAVWWEWEWEQLKRSVRPGRSYPGETAGILLTWGCKQREWHKQVREWVLVFGGCWCDTAELCRYGVNRGAFCVHFGFVRGYCGAQWVLFQSAELSGAKFLVEGVAMAVENGNAETKSGLMCMLAMMVWLGGFHVNFAVSLLCLWNLPSPWAFT